MNSIFQKSNPAIENIFKSAGKPEKVMCVPIDYAKGKHTAMVCNGKGEQLKGTFFIHNNPEGVEFLEKVITGLCRKHSIRRAHVYFGGEDCSSIAFNFIYALIERGFPGLGECIHDVEKSIAISLASTAGAMLTTVQGIGITRAAELYAEIGDPDRQRCIKRMNSYAGLVARLKQTGGPDKEARTRGRSRRACVPLKRCIMDIALKVGQYGDNELKKDCKDVYGRLVRWLTVPCHPAVWREWLTRRMSRGRPACFS